MSSSKKGFKTYASGAKRATDADEVRLDRICPTALLELGKITAEGYRKYEEGPSSVPFNWCLGMPIGELLNHLQRHLEIAKLGGDAEGPPIVHLAKAMWGCAAVIHFLSGCKHHVIGKQWEDKYNPNRNRRRAHSPRARG